VLEGDCQEVISLTRIGWINKDADGDATWEAASHFELDGNGDIQPTA
jgi:hypothetical protein